MARVPKAKPPKKPARKEPSSVAVLVSEKIPQAVLDAVLKAVPDALTDPAARFSAGLIVCLDAGGSVPWRLTTLRNRPPKSVLYVLVDGTTLGAVFGTGAAKSDPMALGAVVREYGELSSSDPDRIAAWVRDRC